MANDEKEQAAPAGEGSRRSFFLSPSVLFLLAAFPGVLVRLVVQQLFCRFLRVAIFEVRYFPTENSPTAGAIVHEKPLWASHQILLVTGPFLVSSLLGVLVAAPAAIPMVRFGVGGALDYVLLYLGFSLVLSAFPSPEEAGTLRHLLTDRRRFPVLRIAAAPAAHLILLCMGGWSFWRKLIYAAVVILLVPYALVRLLA